MLEPALTQGMLDVQWQRSWSEGFRKSSGVAHGRDVVKRSSSCGDL